ncbi:DinB family protein [Chitinophaga rhizophila]|uniref:DinB family protein n=1 Tax=Chitinophaga rhizophila TaxID=2866212 RepID=A0ABS7GLT2_9BACT|nr:DinB family protein [Chitinophaga rhizophila]MBW8687463.1 DinB family protein [Chitinophaga rhizophila]
MATDRTHDKEVIKTLEQLLTKGNAHATFDDAVKDLPADKRGIVPEGVPYSIWQLVEHIRITQWDILEFSRDAKHTSPQWPEGYWPKETAPADDATWKNSLAQIKSDLQEFIALLKAPDADLYTPFAHGDGQHLFREALLIADHTSYHTGEIIVIRRLLKAWKSS